MGEEAKDNLKTNEVISSELNRQISVSDATRTSLDSKNLSVLGVLITLTSFIVSKTNFELISDAEPVRQVMLVFIVGAAFILLIAAAVMLIISIKPTDYYVISLDDELMDNDDYVDPNFVLSGLNLRKNANLRECQKINDKKAKTLNLSIVLSFFGFALLLIFNLM